MAIYITFTFVNFADVHSPTGEIEHDNNNGVLLFINYFFKAAVRLI